MTLQYLKNATALLFLLPFAFLFGACSTAQEEHLGPRFGECLKAGFAAQLVNPNAPNDSSPADSMPGELATQIYKNRYLKSMTEAVDDENEMMRRYLQGSN